MKYDNKGILIYLPLIIAAAVIAGLLIGRFYAGMQAENRFIIIPKANKLENILNYIEDEYVDEVSKEEIIENTIPKILEELDPHSQYIPARDLREINEPLEGNFSGIGIQFNMLNDTLVVIQVIANGPSEKVGILPGDRIIKVDNDTVAGIKMPSDSIVSRLRGPKGTKVTVELIRRSVNDVLTFDIIRDNIPLYSVDIGYIIKKNIGYIHLNKFSRPTTEEFITTMNDLRSKGMKKLILDLRENGGGYMDAAVYLADQFLANEELIVYTQGKARNREEFRSVKGGLATDIELVIIIDENSASASEILAGAIQDNDRGIIIGRRSFGKGLVQEQKTFSDGSALRLTIARYYTPTGRSIQKPYTEGIDDYYNDLNIRYLNGEMESPDSIRFADSLRYYTPLGKIVYGGGGIMPDIFVPLDTTGISDYYLEVRNKGLLYRFALDYSDANRDELSQLSTPQEFVKYLDQVGVLHKFIAFASKNGVKENPEGIKISSTILKTQLHAYIARNFLDNAGFYPIILDIDNTLLKAIEVLEKE
ncbi:MAG: S41 family peptidase [Bacteroidales bacterium]|nr:S41 family peptidase [Bacteroidales bacterium]MBN2764630.1 S41 family peptidase [Bacteroidales bacterium]